MTHTEPPAEPTSDAPVEAAPPAPAPAAEAAPPEPPPPAPPPPPPKVRRCENCETPLLGEHCYACGQPTKGLVRQFTTIFGDFVDTVFNIDSRVLRTLPQLMFKPGSLTLSYFAGHRIRYVSPVRLFVFLSIVAFLAMQWSTSMPGDGSIQFGTGDDTSSRIERAKTEADVIKLRDEAIAQFEKGKREGKGVPGLNAGMDAGIREIRREAQARILELRADAKVAAAVPRPPTPPLPPGATSPPGAGPGLEPPPGLDDEDGVLSFNGRPWDAKTNPIAISWLPAAGNAKLNQWAGRAQGNIKRLRETQDGNPLKDTALSVVPTALFVLLPLFALMLKVLYFFKRRLYMEHLVVALHSHAFLCLVLLVYSLLMLGQQAIAGTRAAFLDGAFGLVEVLLWIWAPLYLLLMQKRVYGQGWIMTLLKYGVLGLCYVVVLSFATAIVFLVSLVKM